MASVGEQKAPSKLTELFNTRFEPILALITWYVGVAGLSKLYQVNKSFYGLKEHLQKRHFNINRMLKDFVTDPDGFRLRMGKTEAFISNWFALDFFEFGSCKVPTLDVFVQAGARAAELTIYLGKDEGYELLNQSSASDEQIPGVSLLANNKRLSKTIRIRRTIGPPIYTLLDSSYTTAIINIITWNKAYCVFPRQTIVQHKLFPFKHLNDDFGSALNLYSQQGWTTRDIIWPQLATNLVRKMEGTRRIGDSSSLIIPLDTSSIPRALAPDSVTEYAHFEIIIECKTATPSLRLRNQILHMEVHRVTSPALRYVYTASDPWRSYVRERLQRWVRVELCKIKPANRPQQFANIIPARPKLPDDFELPQTWDYADDQMPIWFQEWENGTE